MKDIEKLYKKNSDESKLKLINLEKTLIFFSILRLTLVILGITTGYYFYKSNELNKIVIVLIVTVILFLIVAFFHSNKLNDKRKEEINFKYYQNGLARLNGEWKKNKDIGEEYINSKHNFSKDLDIFGNNSLFQWINTTNTIQGRNELARRLRLNIKLNKFNIMNQQIAIKELVEKREFVKKVFMNSYEGKRNKKQNIDDVLNWLKEKNEGRITIKYVPYLFIASTSIFILLALFGRMPASYLLLVFFINYLVIKLLTRRLSDVIYIFTNNKRNIIEYSNILTVIQDEKFNSPTLNSLKRQLDDNDISCKTEMKKLKNIISWMGDSSGNAYYFLINIMFLSDIFILNNLEEWKIKNGDRLENWLNVMGEFEALICLSNLAYENQEWTYPTITGGKDIVATEIGHPLLGENAVVNNFSLNKENKIALITGSNMSGKSTFLRTIGFNTVLAYTGLPTFAKEFKCGIYNIYTCMRTEDNLEERISSFYAEILRIKLVIDAAKNGESVLFLLDEIFKGTNSVDRHDGAKILIDQLIGYGAIGLVSTHDLELCELEKSKEWLINFNFQEYYEDNNIKFDYKLREGMSKTHNAKHLMRLAGINIR